MPLLCLDGSEFPLPLVKTPYAKVPVGGILLWPDLHGFETYQKINRDGRLIRALNSPALIRPDNGDNDRNPCILLPFGLKTLAGKDLCPSPA